MEIPLVQRRESIIFTTIDVINEYGIQAVSTKEVAKRQGISEATVFKYFPRKNDLLLAVLEHFSQYDSDIIATTQLRQMGPREAILYFVDAFALYYENYPAITAIPQAYDILCCDPVLEEKVKTIFRNQVEFFKKKLEEAQKNGEIYSSTDVDSLGDIIASTFRGMGLRWRMEGYGFSLRDKTLQAISMLLDAFFTGKKS